MVASVGEANAEQLTMLLDAGFRFVSVERNVAPSARGRPSDRSRDLVWMDQDL